MRLEYQIIAAMLLDLALGDPRWLPHPVRGIAWLARLLERASRRAVPQSPGWQKFAGVVTVVATVASAALAVWGLIRLAGMWNPWAADAVGVVAIYTTIAARDLARHSMAVYRPLAAGDLAEARKRVAMIVGRDTESIDEAGVTRAAVESVAESTVDGVTAPLMFAIVAGPVGAMVYRAINTLDSTFGYRNDRYLHFGWASARLDDAANYIPARLTAPLIALAAWLLGQRPGQSLRILRRDGRKHESPNSGLAEAAMAGALGVQLGGTNYYQGEPLEKPTIGEPSVTLSVRHIRLANALMFASAGLFLAAGLGVRVGLVRLYDAWRAGQ
jgi:adenosylcobinamide-phosphate synthase